MVADRVSNDIQKGAFAVGTLAVTAEKALFGDIARQRVSNRPADVGDQVPGVAEYLFKKSVEPGTPRIGIERNIRVDRDPVVWLPGAEFASLQIYDTVRNSKQPSVRIPTCA